MSEFIDKVKEVFTPSEEDDAPREIGQDELKGWSADEVDPSEYVDDDWIAENTKEV